MHYLHAHNVYIFAQSNKGVQITNTVSSSMIIKMDLTRTLIRLTDIRLTYQTFTNIFNNSYIQTIPQNQ